MVVKSFKCSKSINGKLVRDENAFVAVFYQLWVVGVGLGEEGGQSLFFFPEKKKRVKIVKLQWKCLLFCPLKQNIKKIVL